MSLEYVIARPCEECGKKAHHKHGLQYLMEEDTQQEGKGTTKIFNSRNEATRWIKTSIPKSLWKEIMVIPLSEVPEWDG